MSNHKDKYINDNGTVLVLVLVVLVVTIITSITLMKNTTTEAKMVVNEKEHQQDFYDAISANETAIAETVCAVTTIGISVGDTYTYPGADIPAETDVRIELKKIGKPPIGKGYGMKLRARYYQTESSKGEHSIRVGAYKNFPKI